jgi:hypothetical protein
MKLLIHVQESGRKGRSDLELIELELLYRLNCLLVKLYEGYSAVSNSKSSK